MRFKKIIFEITRTFAHLVGYLAPIQNNKIVISSYKGKGYGCNPKYIANELIKLNPNIKIVWLLKNEADKYTLPKEISYCSEKSFWGIYHLMTAKVWIDNCRKSFHYKKKSQFYLQTWHGFALKRIEKDAEKKLDDKYIKSAIRDSKNIDLIISCSEFMSNIYRTSFWYKGDIIQLGAPRNDVLLQTNTVISKKVRKTLNIDENKGILLYAPTFRQNKSVNAYSLDYLNVKKCCEKKFNKPFVVLLRLHPNISDIKLNIPFDNHNIFDTSCYPDIQELLCAADIVITDYSSLMFDFALTKKPCLLFATDLNSYVDERNFYFEYTSLPFPISETNEDLIDNIHNLNHEKYIDDLTCFFDSVGMITEGNASHETAILINKIICNKFSKHI